ncbi:MAG: N-acetylmuramoyl-L-alanine amidase [Alphaproteobacteria bacterium]|nr:N-acetylmuramoyl-L-alanine amidase [Alphaproteobacteria bacterium]NCT06917.1 N-acetylmuramoyl-L-alanine amidase [Alphaproteobacteria bacterium]
MMVKNAEAFSLREGSHKNVTRVVIESDGGGSLISKRPLDERKIELILTGGLCRDIKNHPKIRSKIIRLWSLDDLPKSQCRVTFSLYQKALLKRVFLLKKTSQYPARLVIDIGQGALPPAPPKKKPVSTVVSAFKPILETTGAVAFEDWQREPPPKPAFMAGVPLGGGVFFHPQISLKPFRPTIVIDPGHGGHDPGSVSCRGYFEKHVTLEAAKNISAELKKTGRYHVILTRKKDKFVAKRERFAKARESQADFLISLHADSHPLKNLRGITIYTLSAKASDAEAERLAKQENKSEFLEELQFTESATRDVSNVLIDIAQRGSKNTALQLAEKIHSCLRKNKVGKLMTLRSADLAVLKAPDTPSILIELGYLSNEKDEKLLRSVAYQKKIAQSLVEALGQYFDKD